MKKLSIIICTYNSEKTIYECLHSIKSINFNAYEIIIIDGLSKDTTNEIVSNFINRHKEINVIHISEVDDGIYDALNKGIQLANGQYISVLHSDDKFLTDRSLNDLLDCIKKSNSDILLFSIAIFKMEKKLYRYAVSPFYSQLLKFGHMPPHPGMVIKRKIFIDKNLYSTKYKIAGDFDWCLRNLLKCKYDVKVLQNKCFYAMNTGGVSSRGLSSFWYISLEMAKIYHQNNFKFGIIRSILRIPFKILLRIK
jgi:glycosyltransferase involved in cell wall biosynthesis